MKRTFAAPWATSLKVISLSTVLLLAILWLLPLPEQPAWLSTGVPTLVASIHNGPD